VPRWPPRRAGSRRARAGRPALPPRTAGCRTSGRPRRTRSARASRAGSDSRAGSRPGARRRGRRRAGPVPTAPAVASRRRGIAPAARRTAFDPYQRTAGRRRSPPRPTRRLRAGGPDGTSGRAHVPAVGEDGVSAVRHAGPRQHLWQGAPARTLRRSLLWESGSIAGCGGRRALLGQGLSSLGEGLAALLQHHRVGHTPPRRGPGGAPGASAVHRLLEPAMQRPQGCRRLRLRGRRFQSGQLLLQVPVLTDQGIHERGQLADRDRGGALSTLSPASWRRCRDNGSSCHGRNHSRRAAPRQQCD
jgi:hypothetical protein